MSYIDENKFSYDKAYESGWGNRYPDSNIISYYFNYMKPLFKKDKLKMLDFGCSLGANTKFFAEQDFEVYGIDISQLAIDECVKLNGFDKTHFKACDILKYNSLLDVFDTKFDLIVASEVLYYFCLKDIDKILLHFNEALSDDGILYANWVTYNNDAYRGLQDLINTDIKQIKVDSTGSMDKQLNVTVIHNKSEMEQIFSMYEKLYLKNSILELEGENESIHFIGRKKV